MEVLGEDASATAIDGPAGPVRALVARRVAGRPRSSRSDRPPCTCSSLGCVDMERTRRREEGAARPKGRVRTLRLASTVASSPRESRDHATDAGKISNGCRPCQPCPVFESERVSCSRRRRGMPARPWRAGTSGTNVFSAGRRGHVFMASLVEWVRRVGNVGGARDDIVAERLARETAEWGRVGRLVRRLAPDAPVSFATATVFWDSELPQNNTSGRHPGAAP